MDQTVAEGHDAGSVCNAMFQPRIESDPAVERFADDLELPLNSRPKHRVGKVVGKGLPDVNRASSAQACSMSRR